MTIAAEKQMQHIGETRGVTDCTHDLIQVLSDGSTASGVMISTSPTPTANASCKTAGAK